MYDDSDSISINVAAKEPDVDPRVVAMHRVVDLEQQHEWAAREAHEREKEAAIIREELSVARAELHDLLGLPSSNARAMRDEESQRIRRS